MNRSDFARRWAPRVAALLLFPSFPACAPGPAPAAPGARPPAVQPTPTGPTLVPSAQPAPRPGAVAAEPLRWGLVMHGGAGNIDPEMLAPERQAQYRATMEAALRAGHHVLEQGGESVDA